MARAIPGGRPRASHVRGPKGRFAKGGRGFAWEGLEELIQNIDSRPKALYDTTAEVMDEMAEEMRDYMQSNAPWDDRSGDARRGLQTLVIRDEANLKVSLYAGHSVDYGIYLETQQGGTWAIVLPTITLYQPQIPLRIAAARPMGKDLL